jgi:flagellar basal body-associated protein FliL
MTKKKKIIIIAVVVLLGGGYVAKGFVMPPPKNTDKVKGTLYLMPKEFLVNLADGRYGKVDVALLLAPGQSNGATSAEGGGSGNSGTVGTLPEEAMIRDLIVNILTNQNSNSLIDAAQREKLKHKILAAITSTTDVKVSQVLFTDVAVQ